MQLAAPEELAYVPAGQVAQAALAPGEEEPGAQAAQSQNGQNLPSGAGGAGGGGIGGMNIGYGSPAFTAPGAGAANTGGGGGGGMGMSGAGGSGLVVISFGAATSVAACGVRFTPRVPTS